MCVSVVCRFGVSVAVLLRIPVLTVSFFVARGCLHGVDVVDRWWYTFLAAINLNSSTSNKNGKYQKFMLPGLLSLCRSVWLRGAIQAAGTQNIQVPYKKPNSSSNNNNTSGNYNSYNA